MPNDTGGFTGEEIEALDWDFTKIPSTAGGFCSGSGVVPEPTATDLIDFQQGFADLRKDIEGADADDDDDEATAARKKAVRDDSFNAMRRNIARLTDGSPSLEQLEQLGPRYLTAIGKWLVKALTDPKA